MSKAGLQSQESSWDSRSSIRGSAAIVDGHRMAATISITDEKTAENICADEGLDFDRTRVVNFQIVKANSNEIDTNAMTLIRREAVLEVYKKQNINFDF
jgi:hypothetical protein